MEKRIVLLYFSSKAIIEYITKHPIDWDDKDLAKRGGPGDKAGVPPTPSVQEFLELLADRRQLFTQEEYWEHCASVWSAWIDRQALRFPNLPIRKGLRAKAYRNFYPSMIDSLHVWAVLSETGNFQRCVLDSYDDAVAKSDITVTAHETDYSIALIGPTFSASQDRQYKQNHRPGYDNSGNVIPVQMSLDRPRSPGNKRWYRKDDFNDLFVRVASTPYTVTQTEHIAVQDNTTQAQPPLFQSTQYDLDA